MKPLVYVAGPYSSDPISNTRDAMMMAEMVIESGGAVIVPHLTLLWDMMRTKEYEYWMSLDLDQLEHCDVLLRLPGESAGADREVAFAEEHDIPVCLGYTSFTGWMKWKVG